MTFFDSTTLPTVTPWSNRFNVSLADSYLAWLFLFYFWLFTIVALFLTVDFVDISFTFFLKSACVFDTYDPFDCGLGGMYFVLLYFISWLVDIIVERFSVFADLFLESVKVGVYSLSTLYNCFVYSLSS